MLEGGTSAVADRVADRTEKLARRFENHVRVVVGDNGGRFEFRGALDRAGDCLVIKETHGRRVWCHGQVVADDAEATPIGNVRSQDLASGWVEVTVRSSH